MFIRYSTITKLLVLIIVVVMLILPFSIVYHANVSREYITVAIDAGHGGRDGGVVGSDGTLESSLNLAIAQRLETVLTSRGYATIMTRTDANALGNTKREDMKKRADKVKSSGADILVSIHINKYSDSHRRGAQVFYDDTSKWKNEGTYMQGMLNERINKIYARRTDLMALGGDYFITKCVDIPSMIVECGFISNGEDLRLLRSSSFQDILAECIADGIDGIMLV